MNDTERLNELGEHAAKALAKSAGKFTLVDGRRGRKRRVPNVDLKLVDVLPDDVLWLCSRARPEGEEAERVVSDLRLGSTNANRNPKVDEVYILAKDLALLCAAAGYVAPEPELATEPVPADPAADVEEGSSDEAAGDE